MKVLYSAAHGGFGGENAPLGGGAAVFEMLCTEWERTRPFPLDRVTPEGVTGSGITKFSTGEYARFCRAFEAQSTAAIRREDPKATVVLCNDIAEGPDFAALADEGYRISVVWHVDVVAYIASIYCRGLLRPRWLTIAHRLFGRAYPEILQLIFAKQAACVRHAAAHFVPSPLMKDVLLDCYPEADAERIHVLPWGAPPGDPPAPRQSARAALGLPEDALVLLTLSRLSPEKNQQILLDALAEWEQRADFPERPVHLLLCGAAAYMEGKRHEEMLRRRAARLRRTKVHFPGHVHGESKRHAFSAADLYVFPSRHESYGLTLMEAFSYGLPALTLDHAGARAAMRPEFGTVATPDRFAAALRGLASADLSAMGAAAQHFALENPFSRAASTLARKLAALPSSYTRE